MKEIGPAALGTCLDPPTHTHTLTHTQHNLFTLQDIWRTQTDSHRPRHRVFETSLRQKRCKFHGQTGKFHKNIKQNKTKNMFIWHLVWTKVWSKFTILPQNATRCLSYPYSSPESPLSLELLLDNIAQTTAVYSKVAVSFKKIDLSYPVDSVNNKFVSHKTL